MKTILFLENGTSGGGSFESIFQIVSHLDKTRFRPLVAFVNKTAYWNRLKEQGIPLFLIHDALYSRSKHGIGERFFVHMLLLLVHLFPRCTVRWERILHYGPIRALRGLIKTHQVDLVHLNNNSVRDLYGVIAASSMRVPCVSHLHSARASPALAAAAQFLNKRVSQFVANSQFTKTFWTRQDIDHSKINVVYNAIEDAPVKAIDVRREWRIDPEVKYVVGCVGNLAEHKGQAFLIRAFQKVRQEEPNAVLLMVGEGPSRVALEQLIQELDLSGSVILTGYNPRAKEIIAGLDLLVLPSRSETFGMVILEAMSAGVPVVATRIGGIPEIIEHEVNGLLVEYGDEQALASAILKVIRDETLRSGFVANGREIVDERFNIRMYIKAIEKIYEEIFSTLTRYDLL